MNRNLKCFLGLFIILGLQNCSPKIQSYSGEVNFLAKETQGTITVRSIGYGKNQPEAELDAQLNAFNVLLFKGLPGSDLNVPLIENESDAKSKHNAFFKKLFDQGTFKTFMMSSIASSSLLKENQIKKITIDIKINVNSLRKALEQNNIIRKFGY